MAEEQTNDTAAQSAAADANPEAAQAQALIELKSQVDQLSKENANLKEAKARYYDAVLNDGTPTDATPVSHRPLADIKRDMRKEDLTNLEYCTLAIELDDAVREDTGDSAFLPKGRDVTVTADEMNTADKMNAILKECIAEADGDPVRFNMALKAHMPQEKPKARRN